MKRKVIGMISLVLALMLLFTGCTGPKAVKKLLPNYKMASSLIGLTVEEVLEKTGWQEEAIKGEWEGTYNVPLGGEIDGVHFDTEMQLDSQNKVMEVVYRAQFQDDVDAAIEGTWKVISAINKTVGEETVIVNSDFIEITKEDLRKSMEKKLFRGESVYIDLSEAAEKNHKDYMTETKNTDYWQKISPELDLMYLLRMSVSRTDGTTTVTLHLGPYADPYGHRQKPSEGAQWPEDVE